MRAYIFDTMKKTILITGSTDGIGKEAAFKLAKDGHQILIHGRNPEKLQSCLAELKEATQADQIQGFVGDLSDISQIDQLCADIRKAVPKLDVLINNAGVFKSKVEKNSSGIDLRIAVNYIAPYYMTHQLLPILKASEEARIINLSSAAQETVSLDALAGRQSLSTQSAYAQSKLALTMWSFYLAKQVPDIGVIAVNPGSLLNTKMVREAYGKFWSPADKGANILHLLAVDKQFDQVTGKYFDNDIGNPLGRLGDAHPDAYNDDLIEAMVKATDQLIETLTT